MPVLANIGLLASCRDEGGQGAIHAIARAALVWRGSDIIWVGPESNLPQEYRQDERVDAEVFLVELKAAAIDVVAEAAAGRGVRLVLLGSDVVAEGLDEYLLTLAEDAVREQVRA